MEANTRRKLLAGAGVALVAAAALGLAVAQNASANGGAAPLLAGLRGGPWEGWWGEAHGSRAGFNATDGTATGRFVTFQVDAAAATLGNVDLVDANSTHPLLASVKLGLPADATATGAAMRGGYLLRDGVGDALAVEDRPDAGIVASSVNGTTVTITLPEGASIATHDAVAHWSPAGATVAYATGQVANLVLRGNATVSQDGQVLTVTLGPKAALQYGIVPSGGERGFDHGPMGFGMGRGGMERHGPGRR